MKPYLPPVPPAISSQVYKSSGKFTGKALVYALGLGSAAAIIVGIIAYFVPELGRLILTLLQDAARQEVSLEFTLNIARITGVLITFVYPLPLGALAGFITGALAEAGKNRNNVLSLLAGLVTGIVGFATIYLLEMNAGQKVFSPDAPLYIVLYAVEFIIADVFIAFAVASSRPFCEVCENWYILVGKKSISIDMAEPFLQAITLGSTQPLGNPNSVTTLPHLEIGLLRCPTSSEHGDFQVTAWIVWEQVSKKDDKEERTTQNQVWFTTMIPSQLGIEIERMFFSKDQAQAIA